MEIQKGFYKIYQMYRPQNEKYLKANGQKLNIFAEFTLTFEKHVSNNVLDWECKCTGGTMQVNNADRHLMEKFCP